jgi:hypothetical protein
LHLPEPGGDGGPFGDSSGVGGGLVGPEGGEELFTGIGTGAGDEFDGDIDGHGDFSRPVQDSENQSKQTKNE